MASDANATRCQEQILEYIKITDDRKRLRSSVWYPSPETFEQRHGALQSAVIRGKRSAFC